MSLERITGFGGFAPKSPFSFFKKYKNHQVRFLKAFVGHALLSKVCYSNREEERDDKYG
jgi:hypothetical protein